MSEQEFQIAAEREPIPSEEMPDMSWLAELEAQQAKAEQDRADGIARLVALGLTEDQARAVAGVV